MKNDNTVEPEPAEPLFLPNLAPQRKLHSKIALLPSAARTFINQSLDDNLPYAQIIKRLAEMGHPGFTPANLSKWHKSGYQQYLRNQASREHCQDSADAMLSLVKGIDPKDESKFSGLSAHFMSASLAQVLMGYDPQTLQAHLENHPALFFKLTSAVMGQSVQKTRQAKHDLALQKLQLTSAALETLLRPNSSTEPPGNTGKNSISTLKSPQS